MMVNDVYTWQLTAEFAYNRLDEMTGEQQAAEFKRFLLAFWGMDEEDLKPEEIEVEGAKITVRVDVLDYILNAIPSMLIHTTPTVFELRRMIDWT